MRFQFIYYKIICIAGILLPGFCAAQLPTDSTKADSLLLQQIEQQMQSGNQPQTVQPRSTISVNPDIGVIGDFQASYFNRGNRNFEMYLNETEVSLSAIVDPYIRGDFFLFFWSR